MKKILLLGGSAQQIVAIKTAKRMGYYTILCDYLSDNPGQHHADKFYCVSTTDNDAILEVAKKEKVEGIVAYASDPAAPTAAYVSEQLGLPTNPYKSVDILCNKDKFRSFLEEHNFKTPKAKGYSSVEEAKKDIEQFKLPVIIKPVDSSGSKGISKVNSIDELEELATYALSYSRAKRFIIEEFVTMKGYQVAGDGFVVDGDLVFRCFANDHFNSVGLNPYIPISASFPLDMPQKVHSKIHSEIQKLLNLLDMHMGAYNFDIRVSDNNDIYIMEIGPRSGGNFIPQVIQYATGVNMVEYVIRSAMGEDCSDLKMIEPDGYWSYYAVHSQQSGILKEVKINEEAKENNLIEMHMNYKVGDDIPAFVGSSTSLGILLMRFDSMEQMLDMMDHSEKWINIVVE